jgi:hypothetical protein
MFGKLYTINTKFKEMKRDVRFKTFTAHECYKSSRAISRVNIESKTNVSETSSVSIIRASLALTNSDDGDRASLRKVDF